MRHFNTLFWHEVRSLALAPATYIAAVLFVLVLGIFYFWVLNVFSTQPQEVLPATLYFQTFAIPVFFLVPLLTMRSLAEERRLGTLEALMATPVTATAVVLGKFAAAYVLYLGLWGLSLLYPWLAAQSLGQQPIAAVLLTPGPLLGGYSFVAVSGLLFISIGIFASSLTRSQLVAGMLCFSLLFMVLLGPPILLASGGERLPWLEGPMEYLDLSQHLEDFSRGILDTRPVFYYISLTVLALGLAVLTVEGKH